MKLDLPPLRDVIARHGLSAEKALGQNFLLDGQLLDRIAHAYLARSKARKFMRSAPARAA